MKNLKSTLLSIIITVFSSNLLQAEIIQNKCWDSSFAYNTLSLTEEAEHLEFTIGGYNITSALLQTDGQGIIMGKAYFMMDKADCDISENRVNVVCSANATSVILEARNMSTQEILLDDLTISISRSNHNNTPILDVMLSATIEGELVDFSAGLFTPLHNDGICRFE